MGIEKQITPGATPSDPSVVTQTFHLQVESRADQAKPYVSPQLAAERTAQAAKQTADTVKALTAAGYEVQETPEGVAGTRDESSPALVPTGVSATPSEPAPARSTKKVKKEDLAGRAKPSG